jgi:arylsulfatase A-like enzyme/Flp pilus assembly protein TadD
MGTSAGRALLLCLAFATACTREAPPVARTGPKPDVVLVTIDTLRADRVTPTLTPVIARVAAEGASFVRARTVAPLTLPAHVSLMTGVLPPAHGVRLNGVHRFDGRLPTLATGFRDAGHATAAFVGAFVLDRHFGLAAGFDTYDDRVSRDPESPLRLEAERRAEEVVSQAVAWLRDPARAGRPFFLWVHLYDPHAPYDPPAEFLRRAAGRAYDGEVAYADAQTGRLLEAIASLGRPSPPLVAILGDHGESLGEHGEQTHGMLLFEAAVRVPLVLAGPGIPRGSRSEPVSLVDVAPTLLRQAGVAAPPDMAGDLLGRNGLASRPAYSETEYPRSAGWSALASLADERWKLIESSEQELFELLHDAGETSNVARQHTSLIRGMGSALAAMRATASTSQPTLSPEVAERLRTLGYVATSAPTGSPTAPGVNPARVIADWTAFEAALTLLNEGQAAKAAPTLASLASRHPGSLVFHSTWARALREAGRPGDALARYREAVARWPGDAALYHDLAVAARAAGRAKEAGDAERAALVVDDQYAAAHNGLGLIATDAGHAAAARASFARAVELDATNASYWVNLGNASRAAGDVAGAERAFRRTQELEPDSPDAANGLGVLLVQAGRPTEAIPLFEKAIAARQDFYEARLNLGIAQQEAGRVEAARATYRQVLTAPATFARERKAAADLLQALR